MISYYSGNFGTVTKLLFYGNTQIVQDIFLVCPGTFVRFLCDTTHPHPQPLLLLCFYWNRVPALTPENSPGLCKIIVFCLEQVVGVPVGSTLPSTVKQAVAISSGQILVAKASSSVTKAVGPKQVVTQGVAKAIVSGGGGTIVAQPVQTLTKTQVAAAGPPKSGSQGSGN